MDQLRLRTEYSFRWAYGTLDKVLERCAGYAAITDRNGTWGHVPWDKACKKAGINPIFGVELALVDDTEEQVRGQGRHHITLLARNSTGLRELYQFVKIATAQFYYFPRIDYSDVSNISNNVYVIFPDTVDFSRIKGSKYRLLGVGPNGSSASPKGFRRVALSDNFFPTPEDIPAYDVIAGQNHEATSGARHIVSDAEWMIDGEDAAAVKLTRTIAKDCKVSLPVAKMVEFHSKVSLRTLCLRGAKHRKIDLKNKVYGDRLKHELKTIKEKDFEDYFFVIHDMLEYAKTHMLVGPARGSSCGSLVCYLLHITDIDPIPFDLMFERFIDVNRADLPDIDIDFPDTHRALVFDYLEQKYGSDCVARLGTVNRYQSRSALGDAAKALEIPPWEITDVKNAIIERNRGDARANLCLLDTFEGTTIGQATLEKYPELAVASLMEGHSRHSGQHAAGVVVTNEPVSNFCAVDSETGVAQVDKYDAEHLGLLKIDCLGLRTLSVLQDCLDQVGWSREQLIYYRRNDKKAYNVLNAARYTGIFQFEGSALQGLARQLQITDFEDIVALTALARPGPLISGAAAEFVKRKAGRSDIEYLPQCEEITKVTLGLVVYQEQVMRIGREIGGLSWEDVSELRRAMSRSLGIEYFDQYWEKFKHGVVGIDETHAREIWNNINSMGSWAFNRSHSVAYGLVSYWCAVLKAKFPLEFAAATLRNAMDDDQAVKILRELDKEGYEYVAFDKDYSDTHWSIKNGKLYGGLVGIKYIGEKTAAEIMRRREEGIPMTERMNTLMDAPKTPWDVIFETRDRFGDIYKNPAAHKITNTPLVYIEDITEDKDDEVVVIGKITEKSLRDHNEPILLERRGYEMDEPTTFLSLVIEDDTGDIDVTVARHNYKKIGVKILENWRVGDYAIWKGRVQKGWRRIYVDQVRYLE